MILDPSRINQQKTMTSLSNTKTMTSLSTTSLYIPSIRRCFTEDMIINIFWKHNLGKVYRVDFEVITYDPPGTWDFEFQKACVYLETGHSWDSEITQSLEKCGTYKLNHANFDGSIETWLMKVRCVLWFSVDSYIPYW